MIRKRDKHRERGAEKCVSEHWVTLLLNLSSSKVSPQEWGLDGWGQGVVRGKVSEREKGERLPHKRSVRGEKAWTRKSVTRIERQENQISNVFCAIGVKKTHEKLNWFNFPKASKG